MTTPTTRAEAAAQRTTIITRNAKAITAGVLGFIVAFLSALLPYLDAGLGGITAYAWVTAIIAGIASTGLVAGLTWRVPNASDH